MHMSEDRKMKKYVGLLIVGVGLSALFAAAPGEDLTTIKLNKQDCGPEGLATSKSGKALNREKNRFKMPTEADFDPEVSLPVMLAPGKDVTRFNSKKAATIRGFVVSVKPGGNGESCNCNAKKEDERDTHIELALAADAPETQRVIVEVTPRGRMITGAAWKTPKLRSTYENKWVEVSGWLLFDTMHITEAENTNPGHKGNWRATCWEIHPVTKITLLDEAPPEAANFKPESFAAFQGMHAAHLNRTPAMKESLAKFHEDALSKFDKAEREEAEEETKDRKKD
jgi:hypothetical protein